ncbi:hypothetical protein ABEB36_003622 [Hypothenemus hampei]|uniref:Shugoshin C-terminal domain-containing protein n=1 Tax=Hypothenemus hampei TaxID=57062 RepID=A0ABD1F9V2_HYPHA
MSRPFKRSQGSTSINTSNSLQMDPELSALKSKNLKLTQTYQKSLQDIQMLKNENIRLKQDILTLQEQLSKKESECSCGSAIPDSSSTNNITETIIKFIPELKEALPSFVKLFNFFLLISNTEAPDLRQKPNIQVVTPHTVNGTILNIPPITLNRLASNNSSVTNEQTPNENIQRRMRSLSLEASASTPSPSNNTGDVDMDNFDTEESNQDLADNIMEGGQLSTIMEETNFSIKETRLPEITINLNQLDSDELEASNVSQSSTLTIRNNSEANINLSLRNIESPLNQTDLEQFSPVTNSTTNHQWIPTPSILGDKDSQDQWDQIVYKDENTPDVMLNSMNRISALTVETPRRKKKGKRSSTLSIVLTRLDNCNNVQDNDATNSEKNTDLTNDKEPKSIRSQKYSLTKKHGRSEAGLENSPNNEDNAFGYSDRPKRKSRPKNMKEPSCRVKLRRLK